MLRAICGPTAAGKSALALRLAERVGAAIVSADSRQLYRGFDVGTAKPSAEELARVPHFGVDVAEPTERWSAARWADACDGWLAEAEAMGRAPLLVGGTGFYLRALAEPLFEEPPLDASRREALAVWLENLSLSELRRWVAVVDPARAHLQRTQLLRALEVALLTGHRLSDWHARAARPARHALRYLVVDPGPVLADRIAGRTDAMLAADWVDEVRRLMDRVPPDAIAWKASGYDAVRRHLQGELTLAETRELVVIETRQYAKRQRTWFRHQLPSSAVLRVNPDDPDADAIAAAWWCDGPSPLDEEHA
ncbi:tRNA dimethylallyltransferase [Roseisolibacter agri]|uniref:tRNA dimethylallyltransferase n=1 Tax=Roseisolibacter agri TaxID=2014610 RepID=A0AA37QIR9_9BACT|nr:tRNA dimethylallyltransferase [Roseisolibacter agri]